MTRLAIAADHAGYPLKEKLKAYLGQKGFELIDFGTDSEESVDYPDFIQPAARSVSGGENDLGIVIGGSGNGEAMAANRFKGVRCALCWNEESARLAKEHNNANMISLGARLIDRKIVFKIVDTWLNSEFEGGRHSRRIEKMDWI